MFRPSAVSNAAATEGKAFPKRARIGGGDAESDDFDPTLPGVGTNRYACAGHDPVDESGVLDPVHSLAKPVKPQPARGIVAPAVAASAGAC
jgi:hypothetical protein